MTPEQMKTAIVDAMHELENIPCGGIGSEGPTLQELDEHAEKTGSSWDDDSGYHTVQRAWRILEGVIK